MATRSSWNRLQWGILVYGGDQELPLLIGEAWNPECTYQGHPGMPTHPLLFTTRRLAREWCSRRNIHWRTHGDSILAKWHARPVRVREFVTIDE